MSGGYTVQNTLFENNIPLYLTGGDMSHDSRDRSGNISQFSDLFTDLAVPAGLFMMPALFRPRNYAFEVPEAETESEEAKTAEKNDTNTDSDESDTDSESDTECRKPVPKDIFDRLLELVTPSERVQHDVKTRKNRRSIEKRKDAKHNKNATKRARSYME